MTCTDERPPGWVREANLRLTERLGRSRVTRPRRPPKIGELRIAEPVDDGVLEPRIVCVVGVDPRLTTVRAALVSNEIDVATGSDILLPKTATGLPFELMVESDVTGTLWWFQTEKLIGRLDSRLTDLVQAAVERGATGLPRRVRGTPVVAVEDGRRELRLHEHDRMVTLSAHCRSAGAGGGLGVPLVVDPVLVEARPSDDEASYSARLVAVAAEIATSDRAVLPEGAVAAILKAWDGGLRLPPDAWRGLQPCLERSLGAPVEASGHGLVFEPGRRSGAPWADRSLAEICARQLVLGERVIRLLTTPRYWSGSPRAAGLPAIVRTDDGARLRLIRHHLEVHP